MNERKAKYLSYAEDCRALARRAFEDQRPKLIEMATMWENLAAALDDHEPATSDDRVDQDT